MTDGERLAHVAGLLRGAIENGRSVRDEGAMIEIKLLQKIIDWADRREGSNK
jgi:hypothetical protein